MEENQVSRATTAISTVLEQKSLKPTVIPTEAEVQAELYGYLKQRYFTVRLQYRVEDCIFDMVVFNKKDDPVAIIEVKKYDYKPFNYNTEQVTRYKKFGIPLFGINNPAQFPGLVQQLDTLGGRNFTNDELFEALSDLVNDQFRAWYCRRFYELGKDTVLKLASIARAEGKDPRRHFSHLLKSAV